MRTKINYRPWEVAIGSMILMILYRYAPLLKTELLKTLGRYTPEKRIILRRLETAGYVKAYRYGKKTVYVLSEEGEKIAEKLKIMEVDE